MWPLGDVSSDRGFSIGIVLAVQFSLARIIGIIDSPLAISAAASVGPSRPCAFRIAFFRELDLGPGKTLTTLVCFLSAGADFHPTWLSLSDYCGAFYIRFVNYFKERAANA